MLRNVLEVFNFSANIDVGLQFNLVQAGHGALSSKLVWYPSRTIRKHYKNMCLYFGSI